MLDSLVACLTVLCAAPQDPPRQLSAAVEAVTRRVPLHTHADDPVGGRYGLWAAGPDYKASFHDGFTFHPYVKDAPRTLGWRWRTARVTVGGDPLDMDDPKISHTDWRVEFHSAAVIERYDVREAGVEQSFVVRHAPAVRGEIVVEGLVVSDLNADASAPKVGELVFAADGVPTLRYGAARAIDADRSECEVLTSFDGTRIRLHVPAEFVAKASFPLTIDPLTSRFSSLLGLPPIVETSIACSTAPSTTRVALATSVQFSFTDRDAYLHQLTDSPGPSPILIYSDVTTSWSTRSIDLAQVEGAIRWVLAFQRDFQSGSSSVRCYVHALNSTQPNTGTLIAGPTGSDPKVGGMSGSGIQALLVYRAANGTDAHQRILDAQVPSLGAFVVHQTNATSWSISKLPSAGTAWCVASTTSATTRIRLRFVDTAGASTPPTEVLDSLDGSQPLVDGDAGRFLLAWRDQGLVNGTLRRRLRVQRFDRVGGGVSFGEVRSLATTGILSDFVLADMAHDQITQSHWVIAFEQVTPSTGATAAKVMRTGFLGGELETLEVNSGASTLLAASAPTVAYDGTPIPGTPEGFAVGFQASTTTANSSGIYRRLDHPVPSGFTSGTSCDPGITLGDGHPPYLGSEFYRMNLAGIPPNASAFLMLSLVSRDIDLLVLGMPGCRLLLDPWSTFAVTADAGGLATVTLALRDVPAVPGDLLAQWLWLDSAANVQGLRTSRRVTVQVR